MKTKNKFQNFCILNIHIHFSITDTILRHRAKPFPADMG